MPNKNQQICPLFPDVACPQGKKASEECRVRINGDFDAVAQFKDLLLLHCGIYRSQQQKESRSSAK